jgi:hypothetical protein
LSLERDDIDAAVAAGVIPQVQADALNAFAAERRRTRFGQIGQEDESFRFMTGFNDFFFAIGILLLGSGIAFFTTGDANTWPPVAAAALMWGLSELLVRRMRLVLPGILLSVFFICFVYLAVPLDLVGSSVPRFPLANPLVHTLFGITGAPLVTATKSLIGTAAAGLYYWRFRLPFTLLPIGASLVVVIVSLVELAFWRISATANSLLGLACGLAVFVAAMRYDISDRERLTRRADCAFWLHLLAAPLIVHTLISLIVLNFFANTNAVNFTAITNSVAGAILLIVAILAVVAIAIDRRALLVSALLYVGIVIAYAIGGNWTNRADTDRSLIFFGTLVILGVFVITLGIGWMPLRRRLIGLISPSIAARLPPVPSRA